MPNFKLMLTRDLTESCEVVVDAANPQDALHVAHSRIASGEIDPDWAIDEEAHLNGDIYCGDPDAIEETDEPATVNPGPAPVSDNPRLPHILTIPAGGVPRVPVAAIPVADLSDASHAYQDHRMRFAGRALTFPPGQVTIGFQAFEVAPDGSVWFNNAMIVGAQ